MEEATNALVGILSMAVSLGMLVVIVGGLLGPNRMRRLARRVFGAFSAVRETHGEFRATRATKKTEPSESAESPESPEVADEHAAGAAPVTTITPDQAHWAYYDTPTCLRRDHDDNGEGIRLQ